MGWATLTYLVINRIKGGRPLLSHQEESRVCTVLVVVRVSRKLVFRAQKLSAAVSMLHRHACVHVCMHAHAHAYTQPHVQKHTRANMHASTHTNTHTHAQTQV